MLDKWVWIRHSNPIPWKVSMRGTDPRCDAYVNDLRGELRRMFPGVEPVDYELEIKFMFMRKLSGRMKKADTTNIQKLTEDALHGVVFHDDIQNRLVSSEMLEQSKICFEPAIAINVRKYVEDPVIPPWEDGYTPMSLQQDVWNEPTDRPATTWEAPNLSDFQKEDNHHE